jgi:hypothetical protein
VTALFKLPWFDRAWTFQEAIVAVDAVVLYGRHGLLWSSLMDCMETIQHHHLKFIITLMQPHKVLSFMRTRKLYVRHHNLDPIPLMFLRRGCGATDPLDMVYAHLGLTNVTPEEIPINYSISVGELYAHTTKAFIRREGTLDMLTAAFPAHREAGMPSWAIDWRTQCQTNPLASMQVSDDLRDPMYQSIYSRGPQTTPMHETRSGDWRELVLDGKRITNVEHVSPSCVDWSHNDATFPAECAAWLDDLHQQVVDTNAPYPWHRNESYLAAFSRTVIADQDKFTSFTDHRASSEFGRTLVAVSEHSDRGNRTLAAMFSELKGTESGKSALAYLKTIYRVCAKRHFFIGANGCVGLAPPGVQVGDEVCYLFGGEVPYILRAVGSHFEFVGETYCHGFMDGEGLASDSSVITFKLL